MELYLTNEIFSWRVYLQEPDYIIPKNFNRSYDHLKHAETLLQIDDANDFTRIDAITTLKRAIEHRVKALAAIYKWNQMPLIFPKGEFQQLEHLGIAKHYLAKQLIDIRNSIEHKDSLPPELNRCKEFAELTWYFLRSTDKLLVQVPDYMSIEKEIDNIEYSIEVESGPTNTWRVRLVGTLPISCVSTIACQSWIRLNCLKIKERKDFDSSIDRERFFYDVAESRYNDNDIYFVGDVESQDDLLAFYKLMLWCF